MDPRRRCRGFPTDRTVTDAAGDGWLRACGQMLSILVCHSYFLRFDQKQLERAKPYPPLATLQVAALLRQAGHRVALFDAMLAEGTAEYDRLLDSLEPQLVLFYEDNFNFLSKMCLGKMRRACCEMITGARRSGARVIAAGSDPTDAPEPYLRAGADVVLSGEGLEALFELVPRLDSNPELETDRLLDGLSGVGALVSGKVKVIRAPGLARSPQHTAAAAWDLVDIERYRSVWRKAHGYFSLNMAASKGCSFRCAWCAKPIWGNQYLQRSAADVAKEMALLKQTYAPDHVWFADDIFGFRVDWVAEFARAVQAGGGSIPFTIQTRADLISERMAEALRDAGCKEAWIGAESGSQRVLDSMNKGTTVSEILAARRRLQAVGIRVGFFIQLGYLGEDLVDIIATRELIEAARPDDVGVSVSYPLPGTKFHELVKERMRGKTHWQESDDLDMMFQGTYSSEFYRAIRNILHDQVALEQPAAQRDNGEYAHARRTLELRWTELLSHELQYRSPVNATAARA
ncbi:MAG: Mg-protoporphyrin monomethyl ester oxidative cyclase [Gammaproteobacteria bacterium]|nr:Mg-protoporphyrin monomethyl ester oxidative cyclase [Gammaproteobacteria bacterium]